MSELRLSDQVDRYFDKAWGASEALLARGAYILPDVYLNAGASPSPTSSGSRTSAT